jgi:hydroxymethylpyrimidine/phosphomethylpyrimidine kinase
MYTPTVLTIAGFDPYAGAGIQVDSKVIHQLDGYAFSISTSSTAQNSTGVKMTKAIDIDIFESQLEAILSDIQIDAIKIGMLYNKEIINIICKMIKKYNLTNIILDTVLVSSSGKDLLQKDAIKFMVEELFPLSNLITPNIPECNYLLKSNYQGDINEIKTIASGLFDLGANTVLIKGGHSNDQDYATDYLVDKNNNITPYKSKRINTNHTHGTGCVLSSAIATNLAKGYDLSLAIKNSKKFLSDKLEKSSSLKLNYKNKNLTRKEPFIF